MKDFFIASKFDSNKDGKLNEEERKAAIEAANDKKYLD